MRLIKSMTASLIGISVFCAYAVAGDYQITHAMGTANISEHPQKIIMLTNEGTEAMVALGVKLVGATNSWKGDPDFYTFIKAELQDTVAVGKEHKINLESLVVLEPDLIIGVKMRHEKIYPQLKQIAPTVLSSTLRGEMLENVVLYGAAVGKEKQAKALVANYYERVAKLKKALGKSIEEEISVVRFLANNVRLMQLDSFSGRVLSDIGFKRTASNNIHGFAETTESKERIPAMDGDRIFYFKWDDKDHKSTAVEDEWMNETMWKNLSAVQAGKVHQVSDTIWNTSGGILSANKMLDAIAKIYGVQIN